MEQFLRGACPVLGAYENLSKGLQGSGADRTSRIMAGVINATGTLGLAVAVGTGQTGLGIISAGTLLVSGIANITP